jgi:hypothetical protein
MVHSAREDSCAFAQELYSVRKEFGLAKLLSKLAAQEFGRLQLLSKSVKLLWYSVRLLCDRVQLLSDQAKLLFKSAELLFGQAKLLCKRVKKKIFSEVQEKYRPGKQLSSQQIHAKGCANIGQLEHDRDLLVVWRGFCGQLHCPAGGMIDETELL